jgi:predicted dehydrogenase
MKQVQQNLRNGETNVVEVPVPAPQRGMVLVRTAASIVSAGTEKMVVEFAEKSMLGKARSRPDQVKQVIEKAKREGLFTTVEAVFNRLDQAMTLGYSSAGVIVELGEGVWDLKVGQRVACAGGGYAVHAEYAIVPQNLLAVLPDKVSFEAGAFGTLGAIAMQGFRLAETQIGENVAVVGMGLLGTLTAGIAKAAGCRVFGIDTDPNRVRFAQEMGFKTVLRKEALESINAFTQNRGVDAILICADTSSSDPVELAGQIGCEKARVVAVGAVGMDIPRRDYYEKEMGLVVSRSYGPGRYDPNFEEKGIDYPYGYVRWTSGRNLQSFVNLLADGMDVESLISHRFSIENAEEAYQLITGKKNEEFLGVLLTYAASDDLSKETRIINNPDGRTGSGKVKLGVLGAGNFASSVLFPILKKNSSVELVGVSSAAGTNAQHNAKKYGFRYAASSAEDVIGDPEVNTIAILTRHDLHAKQTIEALKAGKNVFCEKPLALNEEELGNIEKELQKDNAPHLTVGFNRRFAPMAIQMKEFFGKRAEPLVVTYRVNAGYLPESHWLQDTEVGGGRIIGEACHFIDLISWMTDSVPNSVQANVMGDSGKYNQDNLVMNFDFPDGSIGTVIYVANGDKALPKERVEVFCGGKVAILDDFRILELVSGGSRKKTRSRFKQDKGHRAIWDEFAKLVEEGGEALIPYEQISGVMRASFAAKKSVLTGKKQTI